MAISMLGVLRFYKQSGESGHQIDTNGEETKRHAWYISKYVAKTKGIPSNVLPFWHNVSHSQLTRTNNTDIVNRNKKLLQRCGIHWSESKHQCPEVVHILWILGTEDVSFFCAHLYQCDCRALWKIYPIFVIKSGCTITNFIVNTTI